MADDSKQQNTGLLSFLYHLKYDGDTRHGVGEGQGLEKTMQDFDLPPDIMALFLNIEKAGQVQETDRVAVASLISAYVVEQYDKIYEGIW